MFYNILVCILVYWTWYCIVLMVIVSLIEKVFLLFLENLCRNELVETAILEILERQYFAVGGGPN